MGVWIETDGDGLTLNVTGVTPCVGVWIETCGKGVDAIHYASHPAWVCGLKQMLTVDRNSLDCHTLRGCVD